MSSKVLIRSLELNSNQHQETSGRLFTTVPRCCTTPLTRGVAQPDSPMQSKDQCAGILSPTYCGQTLRRGCHWGCYICGSLCFFQRDHPDNGHLCKECYEENWSTCEDSSAFSSAEQPVRNTFRVCGCMISVNVP